MVDEQSRECDRANISQKIRHVQDETTVSLRSNETESIDNSET